MFLEPEQEHIMARGGYTLLLSLNLLHAYVRRVHIMCSWPEPLNGHCQSLMSFESSSVYM